MLTRQPDESILIGEDSMIEVREFRGNQVKVGVEAPKHAPVVRGELANHRPDREVEA